MDKTFHITTFGCQMNEHDSEIMAGMLAELGYERKEDRRDAEILIVNTCSVRDNADKRFFGTLGQLKHRHEADPDLVVCVCGCMMQQKHVVDTINEKYPWVDIVFGTNNLHRLPHLLNDLLESRAAGEEKPEREIWDSAEGPGKSGQGGTATEAGTVSGQGGTATEAGTASGQGGTASGIVEGLPAERLHKSKALVNIMYGCNNFCTYCIVPYTRGRERSRAPEQILKEICALAADGVREVMLLGQNVNSYKGVWQSGGAGEAGAETGGAGDAGAETGGAGDADAESAGAAGHKAGAETSGAAGHKAGDKCTFADLIQEVAKIDGIERIRFMTSHPKDISDELIDLFRTCPKLCKNIHLPVQAGSDEILKRMNRHYTTAMYLEEIRKLREAAPDITISTDIIVGFPGETEEDFQKTLDLVNEVRYDSAFTFLYSKRRGTPAEKYEDQIPDDVMHERFNRLVDAIDTTSAEKNAAYEGRIETVLVEGRSKRDKKTYAGRTDGFKLVNFTADEDHTGQFVKVRITKGKTFSLEGELV